ncbi:Fiber protein Fb34 [Melia azedarach]|uniref:Fiber protein Fb34 n=1 Tax=Melia azedarach TaxID=155640 RepID=A0ACC1XEP9_MELAZ|nr:Fiber protein Fb34 [Melia azedarach]
MAMSVSIIVVVTSLHLIAFVFAVGAERRRSTATVAADQYDERTYCVYGSDASTVYGLAAFGLLLISQMVINGVTRCLCFGKGLVTGSSSTTLAVFFFIVSWISFLGAEACLLAGSARNAYHTKYRGIFGGDDLSCATLRKGVFAAGAALTLMSLVGSILYYWAHSRADTGGWEKHRNEGLGMAAQQQQHPNEFEKV